MTNSRKDTATNSSNPPYSITYAPSIIVHQNQAALGQRLFKEVLQNAPSGPHVDVRPSLEIRSGVEINLVSSSSTTEAHRSIDRRYEEVGDPRVKITSTSVTPVSSISHRPSEEYAHLNIGNMKVTVTSSSPQSVTTQRSRRTNNPLIYNPSVTVVAKTFELDNKDADVSSSSNFVGQTINLDELLYDGESSTLNAVPELTSNEVKDVTVTVTPAGPSKPAFGFIETADSILYNPSVTIRPGHMKEDLKKLEEARRNMPDPSDYPNKSVNLSGSVTYKGATTKLNLSELLSKFGQHKTAEAKPDSSYTSSISTTVEKFKK